MAGTQRRNGMVLDGAKFRRARIEAGFESQESLANAVDVWTNSIGRIERGEIRPGRKLTVKLNKVLKIDVETLLVPRDQAAAPPSDALSASIQQLAPEKQHFIAGLVYALAEEVDLDRAVQMSKMYAEVATLRQVSEGTSAKFLARRGPNRRTSASR